MQIRSKEDILKLAKAYREDSKKRNDPTIVEELADFGTFMYNAGLNAIANTAERKGGSISCDEIDLMQIGDK